MNWKILSSVALLAIAPMCPVVMAEDTANLPAVKAAGQALPSSTPRSGANDKLRTSRAKPGLWLVSDHDTKIWLFGTVHVLPQNFRWQSKTLNDAMAASQELVLEISPEKMKDGETGLVLLKLGIRNDLPPIRDRVPEDKRATLARMIAASKLPEPLFDKMESWAAGFTLVGVQFAQLGLASSSGVEGVLTTRFQGEGKPISGLETPADQLGFFDSLSEESQRAFLESMLGDPAEMRAQFDEMLVAWAKGDEAAIMSSFDEETGLTEELRRVLLHNRNARWAEWVRKRLDKPGTVMVAVGAGHLAGPESVQAMLKQRGLKSKRVQ